MDEYNHNMDDKNYTSSYIDSNSPVIYKLDIE